ncbi:MAG: hybrid sensor histidine kinase/response regulator, partial [Bacteroidales bacterium]|nr:hybrid sensor histidine kinase/response regulator [Bacteroidales bacterium]
MKSGKQTKTIGSICLLILFFSVLVQSTAQPSYVFHHLTTKDGLSNSSVGSILKDSYGFLWIATEYGLNRFDGYEFKVYSRKPGVPNTMVANNVWGLQEDGLGNIWINSFSYMLYNREKDNFITNVPVFLESLGITVDRNYKIYVDKEKDLWVLSGQTAFFYDTRKKDLKIFNIEIRLDDVVTAELSDDGESLYGILKPGFLWRINKRTGSQKVIELPVDINVNLYHRLYVDYSGGLWIWSTQTDIIRYKKSQSTVWGQLQLTRDNDVQFSRILNLLDDKNGHIWIGTDHNGLFIYDIAGRELTNLEEDQMTKSSIASNNINCLFLDDNGIIWMGHSKKGISYFHYSLQNIVNYEDPACRDVGVILEDRKGRIWLGTDGNGLFLKEKKVNAEIRKLPIGDSPIVSLLEDRKGQVWIGTYS